MFVVVLVAVLGLAACGSATDESSGDATTTPDSSPVTPAPPVTVPTTDITAPALPTTPEELLGVDWIVEDFITVGAPDPVPEGSTASLTFDDLGRVAVDTGCNVGPGSAVFGDGNQLTIEQLATTLRACDEPLTALETRVTAVLAEPLTWSLDGDVLTLAPITISDTGMHLRAAGASTQPTARSDRAGVLAAVAAARVGSDNSFGGQDVFTKVYVVDRLGQPTEEAMVDFDGDVVALTDDERTAIETALAPKPVEWVTSSAAVIEQIRANEGDGELVGLLSLGLPTIAGDEANVVSGIYCGSLCATGGAHTLARQADGTWVVTGQTGPQWIS